MTVEAKDFKVLRVSRGDDWNAPRGLLHVYWLDVSDGFLSFSGVQKRQQPTTDAPQEGDEIYGTLEEKTSQKGNTYYVFKTARRDGGSWDNDDRRSSGPGAQKGFSEDRTPSQGTNSRQNGSQGVSGSRDARITRQHSQEMSLRAISLLKLSINEAELKNKVRELTDFFDQDVASVSRQPATSADGGEAAPNVQARDTAASPEPDGAIAQSASPVAAPAPSTTDSQGGPADLELRAKGLDTDAVRVALIAVGATDVGDVGAAIKALPEAASKVLAQRFYQLEKQAGIEWGPNEAGEYPF